MATDDAMDVESATQGLYMDVEQQLPAPNPSIPRAPPAVASAVSGAVNNAPAHLDSAPSPEYADSILIARRVVVAFLRECKAEDIVASKSRVALIDSTLTLKQVFRSLVENGKYFEVQTKLVGRGRRMTFVFLNSSHVLTDGV